MVTEVPNKNGKNCLYAKGGKILLIMLAFVICVTVCSCASLDVGQLLPAKKPIEIMGDYQGTLKSSDGTESPLVAQVIAMGRGSYTANILPEFDKRVAPIVVLKGQGSASIRFDGQAGGCEWQGTIKGDKFTGNLKGQNSGSFVMSKTIRLSPTLGATPPEGAIVLFDGKGFDEWETGTIQGSVNLMDIVGGTDCVAYLRGEVWSAKKQEVVLEMGSNDGIKVWLNGQVVHANNAYRGLTIGQDKVKVTLKEGWNSLMLKITQRGGGWSVCIRPVGIDGKRLTGILEEDLYTSSSEGTGKYLDENDGYLTAWKVCGPYSQEGKNGSEIFDVAFAPEIANAEGVEWRVIGRNELTQKPVQWNLVDGAMEIKGKTDSIVSKKKFTDFRLHLEFRTPFMPEARGQKRGNSGMYLQGRYEVQILDSYALEGVDNECGGIYQISSPKVNMCAPPMQWQTYDVIFYAPRFDSKGEKVSNARLTLDHNGVTIYNNLELPNPTGGGLDILADQPGGLMLQEHDDAVQFRNIWVVEL